MTSDLKRKLRCAIYTRKSTEEGLEQAFNSLHAQYEACAAYVASQRHEGWELVPTHYDDGGYSGGTLDRPAFQQLLADVEQGRVDVIVVYKVDRLTRSLADFARIVDVLDRRGASFVSVTQAFNTTNSMGRLTLNVLLSFAQFEREVTGERIRDKIAASKAKGMWMGGTVPLGYKVKSRKLVVVETEAELIRTIFRTFLEQGSMRGLIERLRELDLRTKVHVLKTGVRRGGVHFSQGGLSQTLRSRVYRGEVCHGGKVYPGEHRAIVDKDIWEAAQLQLARAALEKKMQSRAESPSLLAGLVRDEHDRPLTATHANRHGRRYRYYVTSADKCGNRQAWRISAIGLEGLVRQQLRLHLAKTTDAEVGPIEGEAAQSLMTRLQSSEQQGARGAVLQLIRQIRIRQDGILIELNAGEQLSAPAAAIRSGKTMKMVIPAPESGRQCDGKLVHLVARADSIRERILSGESISALAAAERCSKASVIRLARIGLLPSDVITAVVEGRQPRQLTRSRLWELTAIPLHWAGQRQLLGFA